MLNLFRSTKIGHFVSWIAIVIAAIYFIIALEMGFWIVLIFAVLAFVNYVIWHIIANKKNC